MIKKSIALRIANTRYFIAPFADLPRDSRFPFGTRNTTILHRALLINIANRFALERFIQQVHFGKRMKYMTDQELIRETIEILSNHCYGYAFGSREDLKRPSTDDRVLEWIRKANNEFAPVSFLMGERRNGKDLFDDNLSAAERYFEGYDGNYNEFFIAFHSVLKRTREIEILGGVRPIEQLFGRNGSGDIQFVTKWGLFGARDREYGISSQERVQRGSTDLYSNYPPHPRRKPRK